MAPSSLRSRTGCLTCKNRRKKCDEGRPRCERCVRGGFECLGYEHNRRTTNVPTPASSTASPGSGDPMQSTSPNDLDMSDGLGLAAALDANLSTPGAGPSSAANIQTPTLNLQNDFPNLASGSGSLPSPTGTGLSGLQSFLESLGSQPNSMSLDGLMPNTGLDSADLFGGFGSLLGLGTGSPSSFGQSVPYAHIETTTDADPGPSTSTLPSDAAFNELGAELIASHQVVPRPHEGLLLADDEEDDIDPEGLLAEVEQSMRMIKLGGGEHINELYDFCWCSSQSGYIKI
ncbi:hypothetical protein BDV93DRAFT_90085 [Ceratobasidium sp. AG-I]|nr:hypothetical protein BDV93DRAFT_90085 [Ceratobasidium sp. AG-I]